MRGKQKKLPGKEEKEMEKKTEKKTGKESGGQTFITKHSVFSNVLFWIRHYLKHEPVTIAAMVLTIVMGPVFNMLNLYFPKVT